VAMGELKSCLFCGKHVDEAFEYCPHCGYEFGQGDEASTFGGDSSVPMFEPSAELPGLLGQSPAPSLEKSGCCVPEQDEGYLRRLRSLQEILADMERELDLILAIKADGNRTPRDS